MQTAASGSKGGAWSRCQHPKPQTGGCSGLLASYLTSPLHRGARPLTPFHLPLSKCVLPAIHPSTLSNSPRVTAGRSLPLWFFTTCPRPCVGPLLLVFYPHIPRCCFLVSVFHPHWPSCMSPRLLPLFQLSACRA